MAIIIVHDKTEQFSELMTVESNYVFRLLRLMISLNCLAPVIQPRRRKNPNHSEHSREPTNSTRAAGRLHQCAHPSPPSLLECSIMAFTSKVRIWCDIVSHQGSIAPPFQQYKMQSEVWCSFAETCILGEE